MPLRKRNWPVARLSMPLTIQLLQLLLLSFSNTPYAADSYYRWQDDQGNHHYGNTLPGNARNSQALQLSLQSPLYVVEHVIDGDTITVHNGGKVRLLGINTPEIAHRERRAEPLGDKAHQRLRELLSGKRVYLEFDQRRRDRFDRLLAHVIREDGININEVLLQEGLARALFLQPNMQYLQRYYHLEAEAQKEKRGLWALPEFQIRPVSKAEECIKHFCLLRGTVRKIVKKRSYTYIKFAGPLQIALNNKYLPHFLKSGLDLSMLTGERIIIRGWIGQRKGKPYMKLHNTLQIKLLSP